MAKKERSVAALFRTLGPGLVTGAADDDPSGIATYSQGGAQFGFGMCWTMFLTAPFMIAIQLVSARIGAVTGRGLADNLMKALPAVLLYVLVGLLLIANTLNLAADIAAMGEALRLVIGGPVLVYVAAFGIFCLTAEILIPYHLYARYLKALTLVLFAYVVAAFSVRIPWGEVLAATFLPQLSWNRDYMLMLVAIFGTTISPYMFFWQASLEAEDRRLRGKGSNGTADIAKRLSSGESRRIEIDTIVGMVHVESRWIFHHRNDGSDIACPWQDPYRDGRRSRRSVAAACRSARLLAVLARHHRHGITRRAGAGRFGGLRGG